MNGKGRRRYCVIGAGCSGNGVAKALTDAGIAYRLGRRRSAS